MEWISANRLSGANPYARACVDYKNCSHITDGGSPQLPPSPLQSEPTPSSTPPPSSFSQLPPSSSGANPYATACVNYKNCSHITDGGSPSPLQSAPTPSSTPPSSFSQLPPSSSSSKFIPLSTSPPSPPSPPSSPSSPSPSPSPLHPSSPPSISSAAAVVIGASIASVVSISILAALFYCLCRKKKRSHGLDESPHAHSVHQEATLCTQFLNKIFLKPCTGSVRNEPQRIMKQGYDAGPNSSKCWFTYRELDVATDGFSMSNKLGEGGFGCVYKGMLSDGRLVAVKQLKEGVVQGEKQFQAEVDIISRVHHRHLVSLVGYCSSRQRRLLVYHYVPNGTLDHHLHGRGSGPALDWPTRLKIARGAARGLAYLHEDCHPRIIHRDIKSSNILLDDNFEAQVSDFGLARLTSDADTHVTTRVMGTFGYLAPEYASSGKLTEKSDVFSFGVVLLELLTGRKPVDSFQPPGQESLVDWARPIIGQINSEEYLEVIADPSLNGEYDSKEMLQMVEVAVACVSHSPSQRPRMGQVVTTLETQISLLELNKGLRLGQTTRDLDFVEQSIINNNIQMRTLKKSPLEIQEFKNNYKGAINVEEKMNNPSCEMMPINDYEQTPTSGEKRSSSNPTTSMSSSFSSIV